ncbi:MAG: NfeD family protein [Eubacteriales bacterium]|nr:NfeD family protein [Eubacteriales bacterium]
MLKSKPAYAMVRLLFLIGAFIFLLPSAAVFGQSEAGDVYVIAVDGEITPAMASFLIRQIDDANEADASGILLEISTLGGRVDSALAMRDRMFSSQVPVAVLINDRAISAGALISIASETILMTPGSHMGAAKPQPDDPKTVAFVSGEFRTTAEKNGRDPQIAVAMVDESVAIDGLVAEGEILDLTASQALDTGYADALIADRTEALAFLGWDSASVVERTMDFRFRIAQFLTSYEVASLLLSLGMIALIAEFYTQGFGFAGIFGILCFVLYFSSGFIAGYTDFWAAVIFLIGLILMIIEVIVPGFGVFGITGLIAMAVGIVLSAPTPQQGIFSLMIALLVATLSIPLFLKIFGKSRLVQRLVLSHSETVNAGYVHTAPRLKDLYVVGQTGVALTPMRPAGSIQIDHQRIDAITQGEFIASGTPVKVVATSGSKVIVEAIDS